MSESVAAAAVCCPPGSWDLHPSGPAPPRGSTFVLDKETNLRVYHSVPSTTTHNNNNNNKRAVIVFHDVWGLLPRVLSICDSLAEQLDVQVVAPDCFRGTTKADTKNTMEWLQTHPYDDMIADDIEACLQYLTRKGVDREQVGAVGFCWGGWAIAKSAAAGVPWKVGVSPHPSTSIEKRVFGRDEGEMLSHVNMPFLLLPAGNDPDTVKPGHSYVKKLEEKGGKSIVFEDMVHGWTTRSDLTDENILRQVEKALSLTVDFLRQHLET